MGKCFRSDDLDQVLLLPPSLHDWLPEKHLARFLVDVVDALDLGAIYAYYTERDGRGQAAYKPEMMVRVLLFATTSRVYGLAKRLRPCCPRCRADIRCDHNESQHGRSYLDFAEL
jgi:hypothetical protein